MPILLASEQYTPEWFENRKGNGKVSASIVGSVLALPDAFSTREAQLRSLVRGHFGILRNENRGNPAMSWGMDMEAVARGEFEFEQGCTIVEHGMYAHDQYPWLLASPDGQVKDEAIGIEIKCPYHPKFRRDDTPEWEMKALSQQKIEATQIHKKPSYYAQMQVQMQVMGWDACYFVVWTPRDMNIELIERDKIWWADNFPKIRRFHEEILEVINDPEQHKPMLEDEEVDMSDDLAWTTITSKLADIQQQLKELGEVEKQYKQDLVDIAQLQNKTCRGNGFSVIRKQGQTRVDYKSVVADVAPDIDLTPYTKTADATWAVTPIKKKDAA